MSEHKLTPEQLKARWKLHDKHPEATSVSKAFVKAGLVRVKNLGGNFTHVYGDSSNPPRWFDRIMSGLDT
jgi:predicted transcriptional regulator